MRMRPLVIVLISTMLMLDVLVLAWIFTRKGKPDEAPSAKTSQAPSEAVTGRAAEPEPEPGPVSVFSASHSSESESVRVIARGAAEQPQQAGVSVSLVPLKLELPEKAFTGTPKDIVLSSYVEPLPTQPRPPLLVPPGLTNLALRKVPTSSDKNASAQTLMKVTDGEKGAYDEAIIFLRKGTQWVQLDLGEPVEVFAIVLWHAHNSAKVYHDVIVQAADEPDFATGVRTLFNNDQDNTSGLGAGTDREYFETHEGKLLNSKGTTARYLRFYSKGSTESALNEYTEIEVYGRTADSSGS